MADLRTDYKDDILDLTQNTQRKYRMITNDDGTISFEDVTVYSQIGDSFGAAELNTIAEVVNNGGTVMYNEEDDHMYYKANGQWVKGEKVNLFWDGYLYNNGTISEVAGDVLLNYKTGSYGSFTKNSNNIELSQSSASQSINCGFEKKVDLTKYRKIILSGTIRVTNASTQAMAEIGISTNELGSSTIQNGCEKFITSSQYKNTSNANFVVELDVSSVSGEKYVYFGLLTGTSVGGAYGYMNAKVMYVE